MITMSQKRCADEIVRPHYSLSYPQKITQLATPDESLPESHPPPPPRPSTLIDFAVFILAKLERIHAINFAFSPPQLNHYKHNMVPFPIFLYSSSFVALIIVIQRRCCSHPPPPTQAYRFVNNNGTEESFPG
ncbi:hypothetical protein I7I50_08464 [Histoplasma capsulatum G186AR]|uniref:Uncharacterized protein n=1 Tax=Ajellomyces capsulatus TaxID=5037 RepID=A0A8H8CZQ3_AJECA|nr:hypothetical protein I7I52_05979 [Histoplasma capsulatum]QSS73618.1 hypothetical protein I7I50_08464 [Histoplasma capsulatum G186AR]